MDVSSPQPPKTIKTTPNPQQELEDYDPAVEEELKAVMARKKQLQPLYRNAFKGVIECEDDMAREREMHKKKMEVMKKVKEERLPEAIKKFAPIADEWKKLPAKLKALHKKLAGMKRQRKDSGFSDAGPSSKKSKKVNEIIVVSEASWQEIDKMNELNKGKGIKVVPAKPANSKIINLKLHETKPTPVKTPPISRVKGGDSCRTGESSVRKSSSKSSSKKSRPRFLESRFRERSRSPTRHQYPSRRRSRSRTRSPPRHPYPHEECRPSPVRRSNRRETSIQPYYRRDDDEPRVGYSRNYIEDRRPSRRVSMPDESHEDRYARESRDIRRRSSRRY